MIKKGQNEPTFLISSRSEKELEKSVRRKAFGMILIGALMMVGFTAAILAKLGLFK
jgi:preprotein translocase subunit Sss1